jgi:hypothetical protein
MYISSETDYENPADPIFDKTKIMWYVVRANLSVTKREQQENVEAIKKQIAMGIIQANGLPADISPEMLGLQRQAPPSNMRPQQRIQMLKAQQQQQSNSNLGYLNRPKLTQEQQLYQRFGLRK